MWARYAETGFGSFSIASFIASGVDGGSCDFLVCKFPRLGTAGRQAVKRAARGRPAVGTPWPFYFQVDTRGQDF